MTRLVLAVCASVIVTTTASAETIKLAVTTSFESSGLADVLLPQIAMDIGLDVQLLVVGTGQALRLGEAGDVDAVLVHARAAEEAFVAAGYGTHRTPIMYNDFVLIGPDNDPANVRMTDDIIAAFEGIAQSQAVFVSRGDDSGTHKAEAALWSEAGLLPDSFGTWYNAVGAGMGAALNTAVGMDAYVLSDRASWLNFGNKGGLDLVFEGDPRLFNQYSYLPVNPANHPHVAAESAAALEAWLVSPTADALISEYRIHETQVFTFNAPAQ